MIKKRKLLFVHLLLLVVSFLLWNCEKDNNIGEENGEQSFNRISLADFKSNITQKNYTDLSKYFKGNSTDSKNAENQTDEDFTILTNEIVMIQKESKTFYTFLITKETSGDEFYNLVMTVNDQQQIIKSEIFKYFSSTINSLHFEGSIQSVLNTTIILEDLFIDKNTNDCVVAANGFWECSFGNRGDNHALGECNGTSSEYIINVIYGPCPTVPELVNIDEGESSGSPNGVTTGGGSSPTDTDDSVETIPIQNEETAMDRVIACINGTYSLGGNNVTMPQSLIDSLNLGLGNKICIINLDDFLQQEGCSSNTQKFGIAAARACLNGEDVNYEHRIIIDSTMMAHPCHAKIIKSTFNSSAAIVQLVKNVFNDDTKYAYRIKATTFDPLHSNEIAITRPFPSCAQGNCEVETQFNKSFFVTSSDLIIARNAIHESVHAVLTYMFQAGLLQVQSSDPDFAELVVAFTTLQASSQGNSGPPSTNLNDLQHEFMIDLVDVMAVALKAYGDNKGYALPLNYYKKLTWASSSMTGTSNFQTEFSHYGRLEVRAIGLAELSGTSQAYLINQYDVVTILPRGVIPNTTEPCN